MWHKCGFKRLPDANSIENSKRSYITEPMFVFLGGDKFAVAVYEGFDSRGGWYDYYTGERINPVAYMGIPNTEVME